MSSRAIEQRNADFELDVPSNIGSTPKQARVVYKNINVQTLRGTFPGSATDGFLGTIPVSIPYLRVSAKLAPLANNYTQSDITRVGARFWPKKAEAITELLSRFPSLTITWDTSQAGSSRANSVALDPGTIFEFRASIAMRPFYMQGLWFTDYTLFKWEVWQLRSSVLAQSSKVRCMCRVIKRARNTAPVTAASIHLRRSTGRNALSHERAWQVNLDDRVRCLFFFDIDSQQRSVFSRIMFDITRMLIAIAKALTYFSLGSAPRHPPTRARTRAHTCAARVWVGTHGLRRTLTL